MGSLTSLTPSNVGTAVGEVAGPQRATRNIIASTFNPQIPPWVLTGAAAFAAYTSGGGNLLWDSGFYAFAAVSNNGRADLVSVQSTDSRLLLGGQFAVSGQFTADPRFTPAIANPSPCVRMSVNWTGGVAREDYIDFNPITGQLIGSSNGVTNVEINAIPTSVIIQNTDLISCNATVFDISFVTPAIPAATNNAEYRIYPRADNALAGVGRVICGAFQVERGAPASDFVATPTASGAERSTGQIARLMIDRDETVVSLGAGATYNYQRFINNGNTFVVVGAGATINLPATFGDSSEVFNVIVLPIAGFVTISGAAGVNIFTAGDGIGSAAITLPWDGVTPAAGTGLADVWGARFFGNGNSLRMIASAVETTSLGNLTGALTAPRIPFASGAATLTDSANLTFTDGAAGMVLNRLLDISGANAGQIKFPASQNASADANTLDDYEEGTYTPAVGGTATYSAQIGTYTKIGDVVKIRGRLNITNIGTGSTSVISGLPFSSGGDVSCIPIASWANLSAAAVFMVFQITPGSPSSLTINAASAAATSISFGSARMQNGSVISWGGTYET